MCDDLGDAQPLLVGVQRSGTVVTGHHVTSARYFLTIGVSGIFRLFYVLSFYQQTHDSAPSKQWAALTMMTGSQLIIVAPQV